MDIKYVETQKFDFGKPNGEYYFFKSQMFYSPLGYLADVMV